MLDLVEEGRTVVGVLSVAFSGCGLGFRLRLRLRLCLTLISSILAVCGILSIATLGRWVGT